ncbi:MAG: hypothetical protein QOG99_1856 [Frankiales bacterium]|jgi:hypothetical protein|nr:hypothetical protein [Frankiales bacterium]
MIRDDPQLHRRLRERPGTGFYKHMFLEDLSHMLPWGRGVDDGFTAAVTSTDPRAGEWAEAHLANALFDAHHDDRSSVTGFSPTRGS